MKNGAMYPKVLTINKNNTEYIIKKIILFFKNIKNNNECLEFEKITDMCEVGPS